MIFENISDLCTQKGISIARLEKETGLGNSTIRGWITSSPTVEKLKAVADYFDVTLDELLNEKDGISSQQLHNTTEDVR